MQEALQAKQYELIKHVSSGVSGDIYLGKKKITEKKMKTEKSSLYDSVSSDDEDERFFVFKVILFDQKWKKDTFKKELCHLKKLRGEQNIIKLKDAIKCKEFGIIILEKMENDLFEYLKENELIRKGNRKKIFKEICESIEQCHKNHIFHLDLKPENILLSKKKKVYLCDFGSAVFCDKANLNIFIKEKMGTVFYKPPEVKENALVNVSKVDIYCLGVILHIMLTGTWPFPGKTPEMIALNAESGFIAIEPSLGKLEKELISMMIHSNPVFRPTIEEVLSHRYFATSALTARQNSRSMESVLVNDIFSENEEKKKDRKFSADFIISSIRKFGFY